MSKWQRDYGVDHWWNTGDVLPERMPGQTAFAADFPIQRANDILVEERLEMPDAIEEAAQ